MLTGIDMRQTHENEFVFFEANPSPQFLIFEDSTDIPISDDLIDVLCKG